MSFLKKLFGGSSSPAAAKDAEPVDYKGYALIAAPMPEGGQYRLAGRIEKGDRVHHLIRADLFGDAGSANEAFERKARLLIDQIGDGVFEQSR